MAWQEPAGLSGDAQASVDTLHDYYLHFLKFAATLKVGPSGVLQDLRPPLRTAMLTQLPTYDARSTGTLKVTILSVKITGAGVFIQDCFDQTDLHDVGKNGNSIIIHDANDHLLEYWTMQRLGGRWFATNQANRQSCS